MESLVRITSKARLVNTLVRKFGNRVSFIAIYDHCVEFRLGSNDYLFLPGKLTCRDQQAQCWLVGVLNGVKRTDEGGASGAES